MWGRYLEMLVGAWVLVSPWIIPHREPDWRQTNEVVCGLLIIALAAASFFRATRWAHLGVGAVALWLGLSAYFLEPRPGPPGAQNDITVAILLLMIFIIPNEASKPPEPWRGGHHEPNRT